MFPAAAPHAWMKRVTYLVTAYSDGRRQNEGQWEKKLTK